MRNWEQVLESRGQITGDGGRRRGVDRGRRSGRRRRHIIVCLSGDGTATLRRVLLS